MKNLIDELREAGLTEEQARKSIEVVYSWVDEEYPVLATLARPVVQKEIKMAGAKEEKTL